MADSPDNKKSMALARLQRSRTAWQGVTQPDEHPRSSQPPSTWGALASAPGLSVVVDLVKAIWADSPLRLPAQVASQQWRAVLAPMVRQHPLASVAVAAVAGFAITRHRHALMQALAGMATSTLVEHWLHPPGQTGPDPEG